MNDSVSIFKIPTERESKPYPNNVLTTCIYWTGSGDYTNEEDDVHESGDKEWTSNGEEYVLPHTISDSYARYWPCNIMEIIGRKDLSTICTVEIYQLSSSKPTK